MSDSSDSDIAAQLKCCKGTDYGDARMIECCKCRDRYHLACLRLAAHPTEGQWMCGECYEKRALGHITDLNPPFVNAQSTPTNPKPANSQRQDADDTVRPLVSASGAMTAGAGAPDAASTALNIEQSLPSNSSIHPSTQQGTSNPQNTNSNPPLNFMNLFGGAGNTAGGSGVGAGLSEPAAGSFMSMELMQQMMQQMMQVTQIVINQQQQQQSMNLTLQASHSEDRELTKLVKQQAIQDLPDFDGSPKDWPRFIKIYRGTAAAGEFSPIQNLTRLSRCLKKPALDAVSGLLYDARNIESILSELERLYGDPEAIYRSLLNELFNAKWPKDGLARSLSTFGGKLNALVIGMKNIEAEDYLHDPRLISQLLHRLPEDLQKGWIALKLQNRNLNVEDFNKFLAPHVEVARVMAETQKTGTGSKANVNFHSEFSDEKEAESGRFNEKSSGQEQNKKKNKQREDKCQLCKAAKHSFADCEKFKEMNMDSRWKKCRLFNICFGCLKTSSHMIGNCKETKECGIAGCKQKHHPLMHKVQEEPENSGFYHVNMSGSSIAKGSSNVLFKIVPVTLYGPESEISTYALLDDGSAVTLLDSDIAEKLKLQGPTDPLCLRWTKDVTKSEPNSICTSLKISGITNRTWYPMKNVRTVHNLSLPQQTLNDKEMKARYPHLSGVNLSGYCDARPKLLIGLEHTKFLVSEQIKQGAEDDPVAIKSKLGWLVFGKNNQRSQEQQNYSMTICECSVSDDSLHREVQEYFSNESLGIAPVSTVKSRAEERAEEVIRNTLKFNGERYEIGLLWKDDDIKLPDSFQMALKRLVCLENKLKKEPELKSWYKDKIKEYLEKDYIVKLDPEIAKKRTPRTWYLPHFVVVNRNKIPLNPRMVLDAAAKVLGVSLNSNLLAGSEDLAPLLDVLQMFREGEVAITADIQEMFLQVLIRMLDWDSQRFLWRDCEVDRDPDEYAITRMFFGSKSSPGCAQEVKNTNARRFQKTKPEAVKAIVKQHYVDDYLNSHKSAKEAIKMGEEIREIHRLGGFVLRNFLSNSPEVRNHFEGGDALCADKMSMDIDAEATEKILGMFWNVKDDTFTFKVNMEKVETALIDGSKRPTKRQVLRIVMSLYDPLGIVSFFSIRGRVLLQQIWRSGLGWDQKLTNELFDKWNSWCRDLPHVSAVKVPRCYHPLFMTAECLDLHIFVDASEEAYATVAYWRIENENQVFLALVGAKARVAPTKMLSIPRLELQAAVIGKRWASSIINGHRIKPQRVIYWSDSKTTLSWIKSDHRNYKPFVAHRVSEILDTTTMNQWRYVPSKLNVADDATKENIDLNDPTSRWFTGPAFLKEPEEKWPAEEGFEVPIECELEMKHSLLIQKEALKFDCIDVSRFSEFRKLVRIMANVLKFIKLKFNKKYEREPYLQVEDLLDAEILLIRKCQFEAFTEEFLALMENRPVSKQSSLRCLNPIMDESFVMRLGGRIDAAKDLNYGVRRPAILPNKHPIIELLITHYHQKYFHQGQETIVNALRQKYWILSVRTAVQRVKKNCQMCKNQSAWPQIPLMGQLPTCRLTTTYKPFMHVGVDLFGPLEVTVKRSTEKRYGVLFVCMAVRAVHLELANSMSADSFIICLRNFLNRRGPTTDFYSDQGTNFVGADRELKLELSKIQLEVGERLAEREIKWHFNPPASPNFGGAWERLVQSVKRVLAVILKEQKPREDTLRSALIEVEHIVNSRPLTHIPLDDTDDEVLTPNHWLINGPGEIGAPGNFDDIDLCSRKQWKISQALAERFWSRWQKEYLPTLATRTKWHDKKVPIQVGDIVLVLNDNSPRKNWQKGIIIEAFPAKDGQVRFAKVKTITGIYTRPASKLIVLDVK